MISYSGAATGTATTSVTGPDGDVTVSTFTNGYLTGKIMAAGTTSQ